MESNGISCVMNEKIEKFKPSLLPQLTNHDVKLALLSGRLFREVTKYFRLILCLATGFRMLFESDFYCINFEINIK